MKELEINALSSMSGEQHVRRAPRMDLPIVRLHGRKGYFLKITKDEKEQTQTEDFGTSLSGVILKVRRLLVHFTKKGESYYTYEHDHPQSQTALFLREKGKRAQLVDEGKASEIRERHAFLRTNQTLYFMLDTGETIRLTVKGASLGAKEKSGGMYDYFATFKKDEHIFEYKTIVRPNLVKDDRVGDYYSMIFERGEKLEDLTSVANQIKILSDIFIERENRFEKASPTPAIQTTTVPPPSSEKPIVEPDDENAMLYLVYQVLS